MRYPGGKGRCFQHIISLMPPHRTYIETHLGGGAVLRKKAPAEENIGIDIDADVIAMWRRIGFEKLELRHQDAVQFLSTHTFVGDELVYCDPPYLPRTRKRGRVYRHDYSDDQHRELLSSLVSLPCPVIISGYRSTFYDELLPDWRALDFPGDSHAGPRVETVWVNFTPSAVLHDYSHIGSGFRQREAIRRRRSSLVRRIAALPGEERLALFRSLVDAHGTDLASVLDPINTDLNSDLSPCIRP